MARAQQVTDDFSVTLREYERRLNVLEGRQGLRPEGMSYGLVPGAMFGSTTDSGTYGDLATTDFILDDLTFSTTRRYAVCLHSQATRSGGTGTAGWQIMLDVDGVVSYRMFRWDLLATPQSFWITVRMPWDPTGANPEDETVVNDLRISVDRVTGDGSIVFQANAGPPQIPRFFWVEDIGLRTYPALESEEDLP